MTSSCAAATFGSASRPKPIDVVALKTFDRKRYGSLSFANPLPLSDPRNCTDIQTVVDPPALQSRSTEDGLIWDIYSQVGRWLKSGAASNPLTYGHRHSLVQEAYGFGYSQTGGYLIDYINAINPLVAKSDGRPIYDGYLVGVAGGAFVGTVPINQCSPAPVPPDPRTQIQDVGVPVIQVMSQSDYLFGIASRRPDGNRAPDQYRHYEMAGAAHATPDELEYSAAPADIIKSGRDVPASSCDQGPRSPFASSIHFDAAMSNLNLWVRFGLKPPPGRDINVVNRRPGARSVRQRHGKGCDPRSLTSRPAPGSAAPPAQASASSSGTRCRSTRRPFRRYTRPTAHTCAT